MRRFIVSMLFVCVAVGCIGGVQSSKAEEVVATATTVNLTKAEFLQKVVNYEEESTAWNYLGDKPALIDFYADWCGPCRSIAPVLEELAAEYGDSIVIYKINTDKEPELASMFGVTSLPTLLFVPMEGDPQMATGALPKEVFRHAIDSVLLKKM